MAPKIPVVSGNRIGAVSSMPPLCISAHNCFSAAAFNFSPMAPKLHVVTERALLLNASLSISAHNRFSGAVLRLANQWQW